MTRIVVLTGAGISAESGLKTFRDNNGLWENHRVEEVATPEAFARNPALVYRFYNLRRAALNEVEPNIAHRALADAEARLGEHFTLITQNVDNLHSRAGSQRLWHMHGELIRARCLQCNDSLLWHNNLDHRSECPGCGALSLRPDIVWFGEMPKYMDEISRALTSCDLFVAIGTSGQVYPAAGFCEMARSVGARTVQLNLEPSANTHGFDECHYGPATEVVPAFFSQF